MNKIKGMEGGRGWLLSGAVSISSSCIFFCVDSETPVTKIWMVGTWEGPQQNKQQK